MSSPTAKRAALSAICKMSRIVLVTLQVALEQGSVAEEFTFSCPLTPSPRTVLKLVVNPFALLNVEYIVTEVELAVEDLLLGLPELCVSNDAAVILNANSVTCNDSQAS